jgi:redox-sensitive bicupin YhaK (pirin superfamily)
MRLPALSNFIVNNVGGRVVPMQLLGENASPFLLLAHHSHSFCKLDPVRYLSRLVLPEGFPAHPHSGFDTGTAAA